MVETRGSRVEAETSGDPPPPTPIRCEEFDHFFIGSTSASSKYPRDGVLQVEVSDWERIRVTERISTRDGDRPWAKTNHVTRHRDESVARRHVIEMASEREIGELSDRAFSTFFDAELMERGC